MAKDNLHSLTGSGKMKSILWHPKALDTIRTFPEDVRRKIGYLLRKLEEGEFLGMPHARPMSIVGSGVMELRVSSQDGAFRVFYVLKIGEKITVFHAFHKKTQKTDHSELVLGKKRLRELQGE